MNKQQLLKQGGIILAGLVVIVAIILLVTFVIGGSNRMLTSEELALEQTRIALNIYIKQTEIAQTSTAGLYLTLGVPFPTETPFVVPTSGSLGKATSTPISENTTIGVETILTPPGLLDNPNLIITLLPIRTNNPTGWLGPTKTLAITSNPTTSSNSFWQGEWVAFYTNLGAMTAGFLTTTVTGNTISGEVIFIDGYEITLSGEISVDEQNVSGSYTGSEGSGVFYWQRYEGFQFGGNLDSNAGFCATRNLGMLRNRCLVQKP